MKRVAIVGSGIAGLGCAWFLHRKHEITVFEAGSHIGGHSNTISVDEDSREVSIDTGFMVYNEVTYPNLTRLFAAIEAPTKPAPMSFSVQDGPSGVEWNGSGFNTLFAQRKNLFNLGHWRFLIQLNRFNKEAVEAIKTDEWNRHTLEEYVEARGYGTAFLERYLIPMSSAVWSTPPDRMLKFPAVTLLRFWHNHGFLGLDTQHPWRTVDGGSKEYVKRLITPFADRIRIETPVQKIQRNAEGVTLVTEKGGPESFDGVVVATHADQALRLLESPTPMETELLSPFRYQPNPTDLHTDSKFMPKSRRCWASWNYRSESGGAADGEVRTSTHYWMNSLQGVSEKKNYFVTLNARDEVPESALCRRLEYDHPLFDLDAIAAQERLPGLNDPENGTRTFFAGSYFRYGFHEDAFLSAVNLSTRLLGGDPWALR